MGTTVQNNRYILRHQCVSIFSTLWCKKSNVQTAKAEPPFMVTQLLTECERGYALLGQCHVPGVLTSLQCKNTKEHNNNDIVLLLIQILAVPLPNQCPSSSLSNLHEKAFDYISSMPTPQCGHFSEPTLVCESTLLCGLRHFETFFLNLCYQKLFFFLLDWIIKIKVCGLEIVRERCHIHS